MVKTPTSHRLQRVLAIIPYIQANPDSQVTDIASRFSLTEEELLNDLSVVSMTGLPPYTPDTLVDVYIDPDGTVNISLADYFSKPLRLTPGQALSLIASSEAILSSSTAKNVHLENAISKIKLALGAGSENALDISLGDIGDVTHSKITSAMSDKRELVFNYYSYAKDLMSNRTVIGNKLLAVSGAWYLHGWCTDSADERLFRLDRITDLRIGDHVSHAITFRDDVDLFSDSDNLPEVTLLLEPSTLWVIDAYPCKSVITKKNKKVEVTLQIGEILWLERLLLKLGTGAKLISSTFEQDVTDSLAKTVDKIIANYK